ncbi:MAG: hypothetical protein IPM13_09075 [Phycisphaerales bacterium]|nr:hypothetical protein [Phycisphaerales bacterium]
MRGRRGADRRAERLWGRLAARPGPRVYLGRPVPRAVGADRSHRRRRRAGGAAGALVRRARRAGVGGRADQRPGRAGSELSRRRRARRWIRQWRLWRRRGRWVGRRLWGWDWRRLWGWGRHHACPGRALDYDPYGATYIACRDPNTYDDAGETRDPHLLTDSAAWQPCESSRFGNPFLWTAQRYDPAVRLYHFLFRTYSPTLGRWMQRDPLRYIDSMNIYQYVGSMPTYYVDPLGLTYRSYVMDRLIDEEIARRRVHADNARDFIGAGAAATVCVVDGVLTTLVAGVLIGVPDPTDAVLVAALSKQGMR